MDGCVFDGAFGRRLGLSIVSMAKPGVHIACADSDNYKGGMVVAYGREPERLVRYIRNGAAAVWLSGGRPEPMLVAEMATHATMLCVPLHTITAAYGIERSRRIRHAAGMVRACMKRRLGIGFVSLASSPWQMCSAMQMLGLAMLLNGGDEQHARFSISATNKALCELML